MPIPVGIKVMSRWVPKTFPYLDEVVAPSVLYLGT